MTIKADDRRILISSWIKGDDSGTGQYHTLVRYFPKPPIALFHIYRKRPYIYQT